MTACFITVFPKLQEAEVTSASMATFKEWDSLRMITLVVVIEEEFEVTVPVDEIENLTSFQTLHGLPRRLVSGLRPRDLDGFFGDDLPVFQTCPGDSSS